MHDERQQVEVVLAAHALKFTHVRLVTNLKEDTLSAFAVQKLALKQDQDWRLFSLLSAAASCRTPGPSGVVNFGP